MAINQEAYLADIAKQEERNHFFKTFGLDTKLKIDNMYRNQHFKMLDECEMFTLEEKKYLALRFAYYNPLQNNIDFEFAHEMVKEHSSVINAMLPFCENKEQQAQLVKTSMDDQNNYIYLVKKYPHLLADYFREHCILKLDDKAWDYLSFHTNAGKEINIPVQEYKAMQEYVAKHPHTEVIYKPTEPVKKPDREQ